MKPWDALGFFVLRPHGERQHEVLRHEPRTADVATGEWRHRQPSRGGLPRASSARGQRALARGDAHHVRIGGYHGQRGLRRSLRRERRVSRAPTREEAGGTRTAVRMMVVRRSRTRRLLATPMRVCDDAVSTRHARCLCVCSVCWARAPTPRLSLAVTGSALDPLKSM